MLLGPVIWSVTPLRGESSSASSRKRPRPPDPRLQSTTPVLRFELAKAPRLAAKFPHLLHARDGSQPSSSSNAPVHTGNSSS